MTFIISVGSTGIHLYTILSIKQNNFYKIAYLTFGEETHTAKINHEIDGSVRNHQRAIHANKSQREVRALRVSQTALSADWRKHRVFRGEQCLLSRQQSSSRIWRIRLVHYCNLLTCVNNSSSTRGLKNEKLWFVSRERDGKSYGSYRLVAPFNARIRVVLYLSRKRSSFPHASECHWFLHDVLVPSYPSCVCPYIYGSRPEPPSHAHLTKSTV